MTLLLSFVIPGRLKAKARHRARVATSKSGKAFVQTYADSATRSAEGMVRQFASEAMKGAGWQKPFEGPLGMAITVTLNRTQSWTKKKKAETYFVTGKPDCDNSIKLLGDSLNGICYGDDSQIADVRLRRYYDDTVGEQTTVTIFRPEPPKRLGSRVVVVGFGEELDLEPVP